MLLGQDAVGRDRLLVAALVSLRRPVLDVLRHGVDLNSLQVSVPVEIGIFADNALFFVKERAVLAALGNRAEAGGDPADLPPYPHPPAADETVTRIREALALYDRLLVGCNVEIRLYEVTLNNSIYHADDELLVVQHAYGIRIGRAPVLHLRRSPSSEMINRYLECFHYVWPSAVSVT